MLLQKKLNKIKYLKFTSRFMCSYCHETWCKPPDLDDIHRVGHLNSEQPSSGSLKTRPIVVKFLRKIKKNEVLTAYKVRRNLTSEDIKPGSSNRIYINERLTEHELGQRTTTFSTAGFATEQFSLEGLLTQTKIAAWATKSLHGRHLADLNQSTVDMTASNEWLKRGELFPETEAFMIAIQDQVIDTRNYQKHIIQRSNLPTDLCRRCHKTSETIQHITGACQSLVQSDYKHRHDQVAAIIHQQLALK
ncbi:hypothetical protein ACJJTC_014167 [Scirpophaga incertulas]